MVATSGSPASLGKESESGLGTKFVAWAGRSLVLMIIAHFDVLENGNSVLGQHRGGAIERNQVRTDRLAADAHETHREARRLFAGKTRLEKADDALLLFAHAQEENAGLSAGRGGFAFPIDVNLVGGHQ